MIKDTVHAKDMIKKLRQLKSTSVAAEMALNHYKRELQHQLDLAGGYNDVEDPKKIPEYAFEDAIKQALAESLMGDV